MGKNRSRRDQNLRLHIAYLAARMIAEDGVADYASAKQKAARQAGLSDANLLPDNSEIEAALREYQGLYQSEDQPAPTHAPRHDGADQAIGSAIERIVMSTYCALLARFQQSVADPRREIDGGEPRDHQGDAGHPKQGTDVFAGLALCEPDRDEACDRYQGTG